MASGRMFPVYVSLLLWLALARETASLQCYSCNDVDSLDRCKDTAVCSGQQQCYTQEKTIGSNKTFSMGCTNKKSCGPIIVQTMSVESPTEKCYECCGSDRCNSRLCNHPDPPPCIDKDKDCSYWNEKFNVCLNIHEVKYNCRKYCNLCSLVDGNWAEWSQWSGCDVTCSRGKHTRTRLCTNPAPAHGGWNCYGDSIDTKPCVRQLCPVHGDWSDWSSWGECPVSCGVGIQKRHRDCTDPAPLRYGDHCFGDSLDVKLCTRNHCESTDGGWSDWGNWSSCSESCDAGLRKRSRLCTNPSPGPHGRPCEGDPSQIEICNNHPCRETSASIIFNAWWIKDTTPATGQTIVFTNVLINQETAYNKTSGVFVAPRNGTYIFNAQLCTNSRKHLYFDIKVGSITYASAYGYDSNSYDCESAQANVKLKTNDNVYVQWSSYYFSSANAISQPAHLRNYFSGVLVHE